MRIYRTRVTVSIVALVKAPLSFKLALLKIDPKSVIAQIKLHVLFVQPPNRD